MAKGKHTAKNRRAKKKHGKAGNIVLGVLLGLTTVIALCALGGYIIGTGDTVLPNIEVGGIDLGGMTEAEAMAALESVGYSGTDAVPLTVRLPGNFDFTVAPDEAGLFQSPADAAAAAYARGHSGDPLADLLTYIKCITGSLTLQGADVDDEALLALLTRELNEFSAFAAQPEIDEAAGVMTILKGGESAAPDPEELALAVKEAFVSGGTEVEYSAGISSADEPDFAALRNRIYREPKNAAYDSVNHRLTQSENGLDFDPDEAKAAFDRAGIGELVVIPLTLMQPALSTEVLGTELFANCLGAKTTAFKSSGTNRCTNISLAAEKINGVVLNPGETFSFNDVVGKRTAAAGFKPAGAYAAGQEVQQIGGGICQVSSTLYCSALLANLQITARSCHYFAVSYLPYGLDATVSWGGPEFKFKNSRDYPVKIIAKCDLNAKTLTVEIWGTDVDGSYVELTYAASTVYDTEYPDVAIGTKAVSYRNVYAADGTLISGNKEASSYYHYHEENINWPTPEPEPSPSPSDEPLPDETPAPEEP